MATNSTASHPITVQVTDESGAPVSGVAVAADQNGSGQLQTVGKTDSKGELQFTSASPRTHVRLTPPKNDAGIPIGPAPGSTFANTVRIAKGGDTAVWRVQALRHPERAAKIEFRGRVVDESGQPLDAATVTIRRTDTADNSGATTVITNWDGGFGVAMDRASLAGGKAWTVLVSRADRHASFTPSAADIFTPTTIVAKRDNTAVEGMVVDDKGGPLAGITIYYDELLSSQADAQSNRYHVTGATTDASGRFDIKGLTPDAGYQFTVDGSADSNDRPWYGTVRLPAGGIADLQKLIHIKPDQRLDLGKITLKPATAVGSGMVVDANGRPVPDLMVEITGAQTHETARTDKAGTFRVEHLVNEPLRASVFVVSGPRPSNRQKLTEVAMTAGNTPIQIRISQ